MNLASLQNLDERTASGILAAAALGQDVADGDEELVRAVLREVRDKLQLGPEDQSPKAHAAIDKFLAKEMSRVLEGDIDTKEVLEAAGQSGRLLPSLYSVAYTPTFRTQFGALSIRTKQVEEAIHQPDDVQHFLTHASNEVDKNAVSMFVKRSDVGKEASWLLVQTHRIGTKQVAQSAWRIYPSDIDLSAAQSPLDLLKALVDLFGVGFRFAGAHAKFVRSIKGGNEFNAQLDDKLAHVFMSWSWLRLSENVVEYGPVYAINLDRYERYLRKNKAL